MSLYINNKQYMTNVILDKGLSNINITKFDIRPGKISIDTDGNKLIAATDIEILTNYTYDSDLSPSDVTLDKVVYSNGKKIIGNAEDISNYVELINGQKITYPVSSGHVINAGDFVSLISGSQLTVGLYQGIYDIVGVALQSGQYGDSIEIIIPV